MIEKEHPEGYDPTTALTGMKTDLKGMGCNEAKEANLDLAGIAGALGYAITSVVEHEVTLTYKGETETLDFGVIERLLISEFWHSLNRRKIVPNDRVDPMIAKTYAKMKLRRA